MEFQKTDSSCATDSDDVEQSLKDDTLGVEYVFDPKTNKTYSKGRLLGIGGFASVYEMSEKTSREIYAGKIISKARLLKPEQKEKILKEIRLHQTLSHKNVVKFHCYFEDDTNIYIMLECCSQKSLFQVLRRRRHLEETEARYFMRQLAEGVRYIHEEHSIVHRDLKLGNLLLSRDMELKIADFGLATRLRDGKTEAATVCGTPNYIAPEVLNVQGHGFPADVWSMGCILYALLVGQPPFESTTLKETYARINNSIYCIPEYVTTPARQLIRALLQKNPEARPKASEVLNHQFFAKDTAEKSEILKSCFDRCNVFDRWNSNRSAPVVCGRIERTKKHANTSLPALHIHWQPEKENEAELLSVRHKPHRKFKLSLRKKLMSIFPRPKSSSKGHSSILRLAKRLHLCLKLPPIETTAARRKAVKDNLQFVTKWMDFSNKFGFGYQLSDDTVGVIFNDGCCLNLSPDTKHLVFISASGKKATIKTQNIPDMLRPRLTVLQHFARYMEENLIEGGPVLHKKRWEKKSSVYLKKWFRTSNAIFMYLSNEIVQVNFSDHTKLVIDASSRGYLMYIDHNKDTSWYVFKDIRKKGCNKHLHNRLRYSLGILQQFMDKEGL